MAEKRPLDPLEMAFVSTPSSLKLDLASQKDLDQLDLNECVIDID